jgi:hypothetical protein
MSQYSCIYHKHKHTLTDIRTLLRLFGPRWKNTMPLFEEYHCLRRVHNFEHEKLLIDKLGTFGQSSHKCLNRNAMFRLISLKLCTYTAALKWPKSKLHLSWNNTFWPFSCISKMMHKKNTIEGLFLSLYYLLPDLLCYIRLHSFHISTKFKVFLFKWYQEYAYSCFWSWATGS